MVTVCKASAGDGYTKIDDQYCKVEEQENCFNVPMVIPKQETITVKYPEPVMDCMQKPISLPQVTCQDVTEEKCFLVPEIADDMVMVEKCEVSLGAPTCQVLELTLPKQLCTEFVYTEPEEANVDMEVEAMEEERMAKMISEAENMEGERMAKMMAEVQAMEQEQERMSKMISEAENMEGERMAKIMAETQNL